VEPKDPALRRALDAAFAEPNPATPRLTKAIVVLHDGQLIAERYAPGYGPETPIWGHSLSKSITNALIGILVHQGKLRLDQSAPITAWAAPNDSRHAITIDQLLRMDSGLPFDETDSVLNPMSRMFFLENDMARYAATVPLAYAPGTTWAYSNLSYVLLGRIAMNAAGAGDAVAAERFVRSQLFAPLGMRNALIETDLAGTPVGSSHVYASARDFAQFGQLYLDDGVADGQRILPEGWVAYSHSQTLSTGYGAGFWTNLVNEGRVPVWDAPWGLPQLPKDMFYARGALGQYIVIVPSERLVVVRLGVSIYGGTGVGDVVAQIIAALHQQPVTP
jgi:CubicO group peptidase (beta-lactamase class C family)